MTRDPMSVAVCMTTFRRRDGLLRTLAGLEAQIFPKSGPVAMTIIVVDNDADRPMQDLVESHAAASRFPVVYACEPRRGVSSARNRCLALVPPQARYMAFIDDDEVPVPRWLDALLDGARRHHAEIVQGPVISDHAEGTPPWIAAGRWLQVGPFRDGEELRYGFSGNVLMATDMLRRLGLRFSPRFDATGGEDQHFFVRAMRSGCRIVATSDAVVIESVPESRGRLGYILGRKFRIGSTLSLIAGIEGDDWKARTIRAGKGVGWAGLGAVQTVSMLWRGRAGAAEGLMNVALGLGMLAGLAGMSHSEYANIHGSDAVVAGEGEAGAGKEVP